MLPRRLRRIAFKSTAYPGLDLFSLGSRTTVPVCRVHMCKRRGCQDRFPLGAVATRKGYDRDVLRALCAGKVLNGVFPSAACMRIVAASSNATHTHSRRMLKSPTVRKPARPGSFPPRFLLSLSNEKKGEAVVPTLTLLSSFFRCRQADRL